MKRIVVSVIICAFLSLLIGQNASAVDWNTHESMFDSGSAPSDTPTGVREENELPVIPNPGPQKHKLGDADCNGDINYMDALLVLRHSVGLEDLRKDIVSFCDVDNNSEINYMDALLILRYSVGLITEF